MEAVSKSDISLLLIKKFSEIEGLDEKGIQGKKALQKSLYFFNEHFPIFNFKWGDYGPFCGEIQQIFEDLSANGNIEVKDIPTQKSGAVIKNMTFSDKRNENFKETVFPKDVEKTIDDLTRFLGGYKPRDLELLASVHFWAKKQFRSTDEYASEYIHDKLTELKPDAGFTSKDVEKAISLLESHEYLKK